MRCLGDVARAVLGVLTCIKVEKRGDTNRVQMCNFLEQIIAIFDRLNTFELLRQWLGSHGFDRFLIHPTRVVIAHLLRFWCEFWIDMCVRRLFCDLVQSVVVLLDQFIETSPA